MLTLQDWRVGDSGGWGTNGRWLVEAAEEATYDVEVIWKEPLGPAHVTLRVGEDECPSELRQSQSTVRFGKIEVPAGKTAIGVTATEDDRQRDPYHVRLRRRE